MKSVLVTGATGFIGRLLIPDLLNAGFKVTVTLRDPSSKPKLPVSTEGVAFNLERPEALDANALRNVDCLYHLAARVHVMHKGKRDEGLFTALNSHATEVLARKAAAAGVRRFVYLSSIKVNGERTVDRPFTAADAPAPLDAYGRSKLAAEQALEHVAKSTGLEVVIVRPPLVYGPNVEANFRRLLSLAHSGLPLPLAAVENQRSMINVWNLTDFLVRVEREPMAAGRTWLVSDRDVSTPYLLQEIARAMNRPLRLYRVPVSWIRTGGGICGKSAEVERLIESLQVDSCPARDVLGWRPPISFEEGIRRTVASFMEAGHAAD